MSKNIAEPDIPASRPLLDYALNLPLPADFYAGRLTGEARLPNNILIYSRCNSRTLLRFNGKHFHRRHILLVPVLGKGGIAVNGRSFTLVPGVALFIPPYHFHHYVKKGEGEIAWLFITFEMGSHPSDKDDSAFLAQCTPRFWSDLEAFTEICAQPPCPDTNLQLACRLSLLLAQARSKRHSPRSAKLPATRSETLLRRVHAITIENLAAPLTLESIATRLGMSEGHLRSSFRKDTGMSLGYFQRMLRLQYAASLLGNGSNVTEAAARCGWESVFSFSRAFRSHWGTAPKHFAMQMKERK